MTMVQSCIHATGHLDMLLFTEPPHYPIVFCPAITTGSLYFPLKSSGSLSDKYLSNSCFELGNHCIVIILVPQTQLNS